MDDTDVTSTAMKESLALLGAIRTGLALTRYERIGLR